MLRVIVKHWYVHYLASSHSMPLQKDQEIVDDALRTKTAQLEDQRKYEKEQKTQ